MELLRALATLRNPVLDAIVAAVTTLGEETVFMIVGMTALWCIDKKWGYRIMMAGLVGTVLNQLLKAIFLVPRPWVMDPGFTIVEAAREAADGYSFPSGHTQTAACVFGMLAVWVKNKWARAACVLAVVAVAFSRMYLGVHTPLDVGVSLLTGVATVALVLWMMRFAEAKPAAQTWIGAGTVLFGAALVAYVLLAPKGPANVAEFDAHGVENAWKIFGTTLGMVAAWLIDSRYIRFSTRAPWWGQLIKLAVGFGLVMGVRLAAKPLLQSLTGGAAWAHALRYFLMCVVGAVVWPLSFRWFAARAKD